MNSPGKTFFVGNLSEKISEDNLLLWIPKVEENVNCIKNEMLKILIELEMKING